MINRYRELIADLGASEAWGDMALKDGFPERAAEYYEDASEAARILWNMQFAAELDDDAAYAVVERIGQKWDRALAVWRNRHERRAAVARMAK